MSRDEKSFLCLSMTTFRGGFPGIGTKGSMTYENKKKRQKGKVLSILGGYLL